MAMCSSSKKGDFKTENINNEKNTSGRQGRREQRFPGKQRKVQGKGQITPNGRRITEELNAGKDGSSTCNPNRQM